MEIHNYRADSTVGPDRLYAPRMEPWAHHKAPGDPPLLFAAPVGDPDSGRLISIGEAMRGAACNAVCPACKKPVIARQGDDRTHHFAHAAGKSCTGSAETALHRFAKEVIAKSGRLMLPAYAHEHRSLRETLAHAGWFQFDEVQLEVGLDGIRPDIIGIKMGKAGHPHRLLIEIRVTHAVDASKLARIKDQGLSAIEIDLRALDRFADPETIAGAILSTSPRAWLHHARIPEARRRMNLEADRLAAKRQANVGDMAARILKAATQAKSDSIDHIQQIEKLGLYGFITDQPWSQLAKETNRSLQARILLYCYQTFLRAPYPDRVEIPLATVKKLLALAGCLPDWLDEKSDRTAIAAAQARDRSLAMPEAMIRRLMNALSASKALAVERAGRIHRDHYLIGAHLRRIVAYDQEAAELRAQRAEEIRRVINRIILKADQLFRDSFAPEIWMAETHGDPRTPKQMIVSGGAPFDRLNSGLKAIAEFLSGGGPEPSDLFGLDLAASFAVERGRRAKGLC